MNYAWDLPALPDGLPRLKPVEETILEIPSDEQVWVMLGTATLQQRRGLALMATDTPKTGRREVPIARPLALLLAPLEEGPRDGYLALTNRGEPWGQYGLDQAFDRVRDAAGFSGWSRRLSDEGNMWATGSAEATAHASQASVTP